MINRENKETLSTKSKQIYFQYALERILQNKDPHLIPIGRNRVNTK